MSAAAVVVVVVVAAAAAAAAAVIVSAVVASAVTLGTLGIVANIQKMTSQSKYTHHKYIVCVTVFIFELHFDIRNFLNCQIAKWKIFSDSELHVFLALGQFFLVSK